jgi:tetratricopeptide (TPR) repeat protein
MICAFKCWIILMTMSQTTYSTAPADFDKLWDHSNPAATEQKFRELLSETERSADRTYRLCLLTQIARTQGLQSKFDDAHATLDRVEKDLKERNDPLVHVRYLLERGRVLNSSGRPAEALPRFAEAVQVGREAKQPRLEVDAIHMVAIAESEPQKRIEAGLRGVARAKELNEIGWLHALYNNLGEEYRALKQYDRALECFSGIIEAEKQLGRPVESYKYARVDEAKMLRLLGRPQESLDRMRQLETGPRSTDAFVLEEIGEALLALGRTDEATPCFRTAYALLKKVGWLKQYEPHRLERLKDLAGN